MANDVLRFIWYTAGYVTGAFIAVMNLDWKNPEKPTDIYAVNFNLGFAWGLGLRWKLIGGWLGTPKIRVLYPLRGAVLAGVFVIVSVLF